MIFLIFIAVAIAILIIVLIVNKSTSSVTIKTKTEDEDSNFMVNAILANEGRTLPYQSSDELLHTVLNDNLMQKEKSIINKIYDFIQQTCFEERFTNEVLTFLNTCDENTLHAFYIGDITNCILGIGGDRDVCTPHGTSLAMAVNKMQGVDYMSTPMKLSFVTDRLMEDYRQICSGFYDACCSITGYRTFLISTILNNIGAEKEYHEYINLMIELTECLREIKDDNLKKSEAFIQELNELLDNYRKEIPDKETIPFDADPIELWGITEPVLDHEEINETWTTNVAGASKRCTKEDVGGIVGYVEAEPTNKYNPDAMAVYLHTGRLIGYIYDTELDDYRYWSRCKKLPFVGYIQDEGTHISSRIHIIVPKSREFLLERAGKFYISTKEKGKLGLIPNIVDMVVPDRSR